MQHGVAGEEYEGASAGFADVSFDAFADLHFEVAGISGGVWHVCSEDQACLLAVIEGAAEANFAAAGETDSGAEELEIFLSGGESGTGHDDGRDFVVEFIAEDPADFDGGAGESQSLLQFAGGFDPVDGAFDGLAGPGCDVLCEDLAAVGGGGEFDLSRLVDLFFGLFTDFE